MKSLEEQVLNWFPEIAKELGTEMRINREAYNDYLEIPGNGFVLRVRWEIKRTTVLLVTLHKMVKEEHLVPAELNLSWFVDFKDGSDEERRTVASTRVEDVVKLVRKYLMGYLHGNEIDFDRVKEFANRKIEEKHHYSQWNKANKWIRPEWPPSN